jgi:hypothetical protein
MSVKHSTTGPFTDYGSEQAAWLAGHVGVSPDSPGNFTSDTNAAVSTTVDSSTSKTIATTNNSNAALDNVFPVAARIVSGSGTLPKVCVNNDGLWYPERIARSGDTVKLRCTTPSGNLATTVVGLYYPGGSSTWSVETAATSYDSDAYAFFTAHGTSDTTFKNAYNAYVVALKAASLYSKAAAIYPYWGTTAAEQKWNAVNPVDTDGAFRITWSGSKTHDANGFTGDGSTGYGNTHFAPTDFTSASSGGITLWNKTDATGGYDCGRTTSSDTEWTGLIAEYSSGLAYAGFGTGAYNCNDTAGTSTGLWSMNRNSGTNTELWHSGTKVKDVADTVTLGSGIPIFVGCCNKNGTGSYFSNKNQALFIIWKSGLTSGDMTALQSATSTYISAIGR